MDKKELNKEKAVVIKNVLDYKNAIQSIKKDLDIQNRVIDGFISIGIRSDASIKLKDTCIELALDTIQDKNNTILYLVNLIDSIADILVDVYGSALKELETKEDDE